MLAFALCGEGYDLLPSGDVPLALIAVFVVLLGLAFGSFLNVCISRLPQHKSVVTPRSQCPQCGTAIRASDNIPLLSWAVLRGRCRGCRRSIAWRYPAVEFGTAALFLLAYFRFGLTLMGIGMMALTFLLLGLAAMDAETMRLPDAFTLPGILLGIVFAGLLPAPTFPDHLAHAGLAALCAVLAGLVILTIRWVYFLWRGVEGMGMGDAKLLAMIAAWLGPGLTLVTLFFGALSASVVGLLWIAIARKQESPMTARIPFGSFLCGAALYAIYQGPASLGWYMQFFR